MTTIYRESCICAVCGTLSTQCRMGSTNSFGSPDLDLRPAGMARGTLKIRLQVCPHCGYVAGDISRKTGVSASLVQDLSYKNCCGVTIKGELAKNYFRRAMIAEAQQDTEGAFAALRSAAWACDDALDKEGAAACRKKAVVELGRIIENNPDNVNLLLVKADMMRRAGLFDGMLKEYQNIRLNDIWLDRILDFEREKAAAHDDECYTLDDVE